MAKQPRTIAFVNQKGGVSKTTLAAHVAYGLSRFHNQRVLAIDLDPQANLTLALGCQGKDQTPSGGKLPTAYDMLENRSLSHWQPVGENLWLVMSTIDLARAEMGFINRPDSYFLLQKALKNATADWDEPPSPAIESFDYIIIDSPPNLGLLTLNALIAATEFMVPLTCDVYAMNGLSALMDTFRIVQDMNPGLVLSGVVPCRVDVRRKIDQQSLERMTRDFADLVYKARIPENTALKEAGGKGVSIWDYDSRSLAAPALKDLCDEIVSRGPHE